ncbi:hypothetical protein [Rhabdaerophilum calidifontis]|uniref:hypothetical protein n=1 Tax=Rhabdaerophilum calidifontis TaxID=2604328 RepID=UPI0012399080|nr:hypothetical protein [Rhabdaerophilum calidifontis]
MTANPFAARDRGTSFDASHLFTPPRLDKIAPANPAKAMIDYTIYCAGAPHLAQFARLTGIATYKIGVARYGALNRIAGLSRHHYAGYWGRPGDDIAAMTPLPGANAWTLIRLARPDALGPSICDLVEFQEDGIRISLPACLHPETVDGLVDSLLTNLSLRSALSTEAGQQRLRNGGVDQHGWFYTHYRNRDAPDQLAEARELYVINLKSDVALLAQGLGELVRHYTGGNNDG